MPAIREKKSKKSVWGRALTANISAQRHRIESRMVLGVTKMMIPRRLIPLSLRSEQKSFENSFGVKLNVGVFCDQKVFLGTLEFQLNSHSNYAIFQLSTVSSKEETRSESAKKFQFIDQSSA
jgi:hypothetical protein